MMRSQSAFRFFSVCHCIVGFGVMSVVALATCPLVASENRENWVTKAYAKNVNAVVSIQGDKVDEFSGSSRSSGDSAKSFNGMGTGIIVDERGYIVTNYHVVQGIRKIQVTTYDKSRYIATLEERDEETDLAIIKITPKKPLQTIMLGFSDDIMPGEFCMAIGNPYGYAFKATHGLVSGVGEEVAVNDDLLYRNAIQTSTPINPGNSGGPLINVDGKMIGINAAIRQGAECIAFAIPVDQVVDVAARLIGKITERTVSHGINVYQTDSESAVAKRAGVPQGATRRSIVVVDSINANSPATAAGLKPGDVITGIGQFSVENKLDFHRAMLDNRTGDDLGFAVLRELETFDFPLALAAPRSEGLMARGGTSRSNLPLTPGPGRATPGPKIGNQARSAEDAVWETLGLKYAPIPKAEYQRTFAQYLGVYPHGGVVVESVREGSPFAQKGIKQDDVIVGVHDWVATSTNDLRYIAKVWPSLNPPNGLVRVELFRNGVSYFVEIPVKK